MAFQPIITQPSTLEAKQAAVLSEANRLAKALVSSAISNLNSTHRLIFNNVDGLTPQEALDSFGVNGANFFAAFSQIKADIEAISGQSITLVYPEGVTGVQANQDGSLSVKA